MQGHPAVPAECLYFVPRFLIVERLRSTRHARVSFAARGEPRVLFLPLALHSPSPLEGAASGSYCFFDCLYASSAAETALRDLPAVSRRLHQLTRRTRDNSTNTPREELQTIPPQREPVLDPLDPLTIAPAEMPRVKLDDLPTEVKTRIVELCAEQDERSQERLTAIERMGGAELALDQIRARHGRSVGTLFCLSRSWSEIAAPSRFKVLKLSQTEDITFRVWVSHKRLAFFTALIIDKATAPAYEAFLPILGGLPDVRTLILHQPFFDRILAAQPIAQRSIDGGPHLTPLGCVCIGELRKTIQRVERLDIQLENYPLSRSIAGKTSSTLKTLRFNLKCLAGKSNKLLAFLALFPSLQTLEIDCDTATSDDVDVFQGSPQALPALARLVIERPSSNKHAARLAAVFAGSLRSLRIQSHEHRFPGYISLDVVFALVQRLELAGEWFSVSPFYSFATPRTFPGLRVIELAADHMIGIGDESSLLPVLEAFTALPTHPLSQVVLRNASRVTYAEERAYVERWNADNPRVRIDLGVDLLPAPNTLHGDAFDETSDADDFEAGRSEVATTLDFLTDWHQRIRAGGPTEREEYTRLAEILEVAEFERFALQA